MAGIYLKKRIGQRVLDGHPWIYVNEVDRMDDMEPGAIADIYTSDKRFLGKGYVNPRSQIIARILTRDKNEIINDDFFYRRILQAWMYRKKLGYTENCRLVFGEADLLPQCIIDKFNDYFVVQTLALGMDKWKSSIVDAIVKIFDPKGIFERNDVPVRELEGLAQQKGILYGDFDPAIIIEENGLRFHVDMENGQKTGYFLDQQDNRKRLKQIVKDAEVLGAFTYTGTFEIHAAHYGARSVKGLDISEQAVMQATRNAALNGYSEICRFECGNAFDALKEWSKQGKQYDVVMLDPPSFAKSREQVQKAVAGYKEINLRGMKLIRPGGFLVTSSCTNLVSPELFVDTIRQAAKDAKKNLRQVCFQSQSPDHPIVLGWENTHYLKFLIVQVQ